MSAALVAASYLPLPWPFEFGYMQLALLAGLVVGGCAPLVGTFLVQKRLSLMGDGIGHLAFAGVAGGILADIWPIWTALAATVAGALFIEWLRKRSRSSGDLALALVFYVGIAGGSVLIGLAHSLNANLLSYLFGSILTVSPSDVAVVAVVGLLIVAVIAVAGRALFAVVLDEDAARVAGLPVDALNAALAVLTAVVVVASMRVVGILLVSALMVLPVGAAQAATRSFRQLLLTSAAFGASAVIFGLVIARAADTAPGGTIVLVAGAELLVTTLVSSRSQASNRRGAHGTPRIGPEGRSDEAGS